MLLLGANSTGSHGGEVAEAVDFDGTNDYLSRSSDLTGNADGKTFTFSAWVWPNTVAAFQMLYRIDGYFYVAINSSNQLAILGVNSFGVTILSATVSTIPPIQTMAHILVSIDLATTANRSIYINDVVQTVTWTTYQNDLIHFSRINQSIGASITGAVPFKGRLSHVYLDYTYRDLSIEANRRLFITVDRKPADNQAALNPILYLPMTDPSTVHINKGTGGNFTLNGVVAQSGRGPNQFNVPYSDLDGSADYLSRTSLTGIADGKQFTLAFSGQADGSCVVAGIGVSGEIRLHAFFYESPYKRLRIQAANATGTTILNFWTADNSIELGRNYNIAISIDLSSTSKRKLYVNGVSTSATWSTYTNDSIDFTGNLYAIGGQYNGFTYFNGRLGNVFFHTSYIDLSDPANLAKFCVGTGIDCKPVDMGANGELPLGTSPLIYLPMYANNAGKNYGTGGDFTVNSGPYTGARGPNEFWGNKINFAVGYLYKSSSPYNSSNTSSFSCSFYYNTTNNSNFIYSQTSGGYIFKLYKAGTLLIGIGETSGGIKILDFICDMGSNFGYVQLSIDVSNPSKRFIYVDGVSKTTTWNTYTDDLFAWSAYQYNIIHGTYDSEVPQYVVDNPGPVVMSEFYFTTDYIDFSQESNRLKFRDAFGNPVDLQPQIDAGEIPNPAIYLRFDPANQGKNYGTGGDYTKVGTILDAGQL